MRFKTVNPLALCCIIYIAIKFPVIGIMLMVYVVGLNIFAFCLKDESDDKEPMYKRYRKYKEHFENSVKQELTQENKDDYHFTFNLIMRCMVENFYNLHINDDLRATYVGKPFMEDRHLAWNYFKKYVHDSNLVLDYLLHKHNLSMGFTDWFIDLDIKNLYDQGITNSEVHHKKIKRAYRRALRRELFHLPFIFWRKRKVMFLNKDYFLFEPLWEVINELNLKVIETSDGELIVTHKR